jgi:hypothetical protein
VIKIKYRGHEGVLDTWCGMYGWGAAFVGDDIRVPLSLEHRTKEDAIDEALDNEDVDLNDQS